MLRLYMLDSAGEEEDGSHLGSMSHTHLKSETHHAQKKPRHYIRIDHVVSQRAWCPIELPCYPFLSPINKNYHAVQAVIYEVKNK